MAVLSFREVIPRTISQKFGESPTAERKYICTVDEPTASQTIINSVGIFFGSSHPEFSFLKMLNVSLSETDRHHVEVIYSYELPKQKDFDQNPLARPDVWSFSVGGAQVPALFYYHGTENNDIRPLITGAGDFIEGLTTTEAEIRATIAGNRATFDLGLAATVTNAINKSAYLGFPQYTWQCAGISGQQAAEVVNDVEVRYYQVNVELVYRRSGWVLKPPHIGWHYLDGGKKRRVWAWNEDGVTKEDANTPQPLNENGTLKFPGADGIPDQLQRRVNPVVEFSTYFGSPAF